MGTRTEWTLTGTKFGSGLYSTTQLGDNVLDATLIIVHYSAPFRTKSYVDLRDEKECSTTQSIVYCGHKVYQSRTSYGYKDGSHFLSLAPVDGIARPRQGNTRRRKTILVR